MKSRVPGDVLLGWLPAAAGLLILANDFGLRRWHPGFLSGKLSDIGICFLFPVVLVALWQWMSFALCWVLRRTWKPSGRYVHVASCVVAAAYYSAMEMLPGFGGLHKLVLSTIFPFTRFRSGTPDPTDLVALVMIPMSLLYLRRREGVVMGKD